MCIGALTNEASHPRGGSHHPLLGIGHKPGCGGSGEARIGARRPAVLPLAVNFGSLVLSPLALLSTMSFPGVW